MMAAICAVAVTAAQIALCESCHGPGGNSAMAGTPSIAGQPVTFLENQLIFFREGLRRSDAMQPLVAGMKDEDITAFARHFSAREAKVATPAAPDPKLAARGAELGRQRHCGQCHLPSYRGRDQIPRLASQREDYLYDTMRAYRDGKLKGTDTTMAEVLDGLSDADLRALAHYLARL